VELFAVENRKSPIIIASQPSQKIADKVVASSASVTSNTTIAAVRGTAVGSSMLRNSLIGLQAELLRIEAEKEQSLFDDERILNEKVTALPCSS